MSRQPDQEPVRPFSFFAGFLSYLVPGLGQISQGRIGKGVLFMVCLLSLFHVGEAMGNWQNVYVPNAPVTDGNGHVVGKQRGNPLYNIVNYRWHFAGQVWIGAAAWPAIWQYYGGSVPSEETSHFLHNYQKEPSVDAVNAFLVNSDKTPDLGWIYTVIAGMLNVLVIYDAYAGPAYGPRVPRAVKENVPVPEAASS
jgi:hypothetical protein